MTDREKPTHLENGDALEDFLATHEVALIEWYTSGCAMCQAMEPVLGTVARARAMPIGMINPGGDIALADRFNIQSVPTLLLVVDGQEIARLADGFCGAESVIEFCDAHVPGGDPHSSDQTSGSM